MTSNRDIVAYVHAGGDLVEETRPCHEDYSRAATLYLSGDHSGSAQLFGEVRARLAAIGSRFAALPAPVECRQLQSLVNTFIEECVQGAGKMAEASSRGDGELAMAGDAQYKAAQDYGVQAIREVARLQARLK